MKEEFEKRFHEQLEKNRNRVIKAIFGRTLLLFFAIFLQIFLMLVFMSMLGDYIWFYYGAGIVTALFLIMHIMNRDVNPAYKIAWAVPIALVPVFGSFFYMFVHMQPEVRKRGKKLDGIILESSRHLIQEEDILKEIEKKDASFFGLVNYMNKFGGFPVYRNHTAEYFPLGEDKFISMIEELKKAKKFIFMEYFIVDDGFMWRTVLDILVDKVREGVDVRFMYDGMCTLTTVPPWFPKLLNRYGIKCRVFAPIRPFLTTSQNHRDHRKILVIDGETAYTGGINLADEYVNVRERFGHWKDTAIMLKGEAVKSFTMMFLQNWNLFEDENEYKKFIPEFNDNTQDGFVMPFGDSPYDNELVSETVYLHIINHAKKYIHIMTPYLILDNEMYKALEYAAKRGVDVKIICPHIFDKPSAYMIARTYYEKLIEKGIKIYEYTPGFIHAKVFISDDYKAVVGTINLDFRSLYLNFECGVYLHEASVINIIENDYQKTLKLSEEITLGNCRNYSKIKLLVGKFLWVFGPLM